MIAVEIGIIVHFAGGLVVYDGKRLYDHYFLAIRYDKYVHFLNSVAMGLLVRNIFSIAKVKLKQLNELVIFFIVLGLGAFIEIFEYIVTKNIKYNGVGNYNNNMQDLISNATGVLCCLITIRTFYFIQKKLKNDTQDQDC